MTEEMERISSPCHCNVLRKAARHVSQAYDLALAPSGLKGTQFSLLVEISKYAEPPALGELAEIMVMDRSTLGHNLRPLEKAGWVRLTADPSDRRSVRLTLTAKGRKKLQNGLQLWESMQARLEETFGRGQTDSLRGLLLRLATTNI